MEKVTRINIPLQSTLHRRMKATASELGLKVKDFVVGAILKAVTDARRERSNEDSRMNDEDSAWLDAGGSQAIRLLEDVEKEIPEKELSTYLKAFQKKGTPIKWNPRKGKFEEGTSKR